MKQLKTIIRYILKQESDYYKSIRVCNFWNNNYVEYESNSDKNKKTYQ